MNTKMRIERFEGKFAADAVMLISLRQRDLLTGASATFDENGDLLSATFKFAPKEIPEL